MYPRFRARLPLVALAGILLALAPAPARAYYDDTHYSFTYYMARAVGYTPMQAHRVASGCVSVDYSKATEPEQYRNVFNPFAASGTAQVPRIRFHAFMSNLSHPDCLKDPAQKAKAQAEIPVQRERLWDIGVKDGNPGAFLHFFQDETSHGGYSSWGGHWASWGAYTNDLPVGPTCDFLSNLNPEHHYGMINGTLERLQRFMALASSKQKPRTVNRAREILPLLKELRDASPAPKPLGLSDALLIGRALAGEAGPITYLQILSRGYDLKKGPDVDAANKRIQAALTAWGELEPFPTTRVVFDYDGEGNLLQVPALTQCGAAGTAQQDSLGPRDRFVLHGTLKVRVRKEEGGQEVDADGAEVTLKAAPTRKGEDEYELGKETAAGGTATFEKMPVGRIIVEARLGKGLKKRETVTLDRVEREVTVVVKPDEVARSVVFLVDASDSMAGRKIEAARQAVAELIRQAAAGDEAEEWAILAFGGHNVLEIQEFTRDADAAAKAAGTLALNGDTPLRYAQAKATAYLLKYGKGAEGKLVILCDGQDNCPGPAHGKSGATGDTGGARDKLLTLFESLKLPNRGENR